MIAFLIGSAMGLAITALIAGEMPDLGQVSCSTRGRRRATTSRMVTLTVHAAGRGSGG